MADLGRSLSRRLRLQRFLSQRWGFRLIYGYNQRKIYSRRVFMAMEGIRGRCGLRRNGEMPGQ